MGLLDDAIREHLELKRKRGADPDEVAKQEREALGPIGAGTAAAAAPPAAGTVAPALDEEPPDTASPDLHEEPYEEEPPSGGRYSEVPFADEPRGAGLTDEPPVSEPYIDEPPARERYADEPPLPPPAREPAGSVRMPEPEPEPEPEPPAAGPPAPEPRLDQPTQQFSAADVDDAVVPADEEPEGEDVLDETPDFLQEAPEHDRLWFEQRPPRDFDF